MLALALKYTAVRGGVAVLILLQAMLWSRLLQPDEYAVYALVMGAGMLVRALLLNWISAVVVRFFPDQSLEPGIRLAAANTVFFAIAGGLLLLFLAALPWLGRLVAPPLACAALVIAILGGWVELSQQLSRARLEHRRLALKMLGFELLKFGLGLALILSGWRAFGLIGATAGALLGVSLLWMRADGVRFLGRGTSWRAVLGPMLRYGWPIAVTGGLAQLLSVADRYMLLWLADESTAGSYALAFEVARQPVWLVMVAASTASMPLAIQAVNRAGLEAATGVLKSHATTMLLLALPVTAIEVAFAKPVAALVLGEAFRDAGTAIMPIVAIATFVNGWRSFYLDVSTHLIRRSQAFIGMALTIVAVNLAMNAALIPHFGVIGAAWATLVAQLGGVVYFLLLVPRAPVLALSWPDIGKIALALGLAMATAIALDAGRGGPWLMLALAAGGAVYLVVLVTLRAGDLRLPRLQNPGS